MCTRFHFLALSYNLIWVPTVAVRCSLHEIYVFRLLNKHVRHSCIPSVFKFLVIYLEIAKALDESLKSKISTNYGKECCKIWPSHVTVIRL